MQSIRQLGGGVIIAIVSVVLVLGGIFLSLAETLPQSATPTQTPALQTATETATASPSATATQPFVAPASCTPPVGWVRILTATGDTIYSLAQRYKTSAENLSAANCLTSFDLSVGYVLYVPPVPTVTIIPCGPPAGWVKTHIVQAGDNLYRIALSYGLTYPQLQRANCMGGSTTIYAGQRLWVPNISTRTPVPGVTVIPDFPTETSLPTAITLTAIDTATEIPTATATQTSLPTATATQTSIPTITNTPPSPPAPQ